jgi:hypothetical protein
MPDVAMVVTLAVEPSFRNIYLNNPDALEMGAK